jgi:two-component system, chemotaxis family, chemotaxis protein CheY
MNFVNNEQQVSSESQWSRESSVQGTSAGYLENVKFLIVDDNTFMRSIVKHVLGSLEARHFREATDGAEALKVLQSFTPDIAIIDWEMEPLNGLELAQMIRTASDSVNPYMPIIMLSGHSEMSRVIEARDAGVNEFVVKPISVKSLYSRIDSLIHRPRDFVKTGQYFGPDRRRRTIDIGMSDRRCERNVESENGLNSEQVDKLFA